MNKVECHQPLSRLQPADHHRGSDKLRCRSERSTALLRKPPWLRIRLPSSGQRQQLHRLFRQTGLHTVCEEANCPNLPECFSRGTASFLVMGDICTRRCPFCDVASGRPMALDPKEPEKLAQAVAKMGLRHVVVTSVNRDDLPDAGAAHIASCVSHLRAQLPQLRVEILVPDFRRRQKQAIACFAHAQPDIFNHNLETVPRLYKTVRPGADYLQSLRLLLDFRAAYPDVPTKSGLMLGLGEEEEEVIAVMRDLRAHHCQMLTLGQYLQPGPAYLPVQRYLPPESFDLFKERALGLGFTQVAAGPLVRSSYYADKQADALLEKHA